MKLFKVYFWLSCPEAVKKRMKFQTFACTVMIITVLAVLLNYLLFYKNGANKEIRSMEGMTVYVVSVWLIYITGRRLFGRMMHQAFILRYPVRLFTWVLTGIAVITIVSALVLLYGCLAVSLLFQKDVLFSPERLAAVAILAVIMSSVQFFLKTLKAEYLFVLLMTLTPFFMQSGTLYLPWGVSWLLLTEYSVNDIGLAVYLISAGYIAVCMCWILRSGEEKIREKFAQSGMDQTQEL